MWPVAGSCLGRAIAIAGAMDFEYIVAKHEMVKKSCGCMAHGQTRKRPCAEFMRKMKRGL